MLLLHSSDDHVTPVEQSIELFQHAGQPTELHLFSDTDHFMFAEANTRAGLLRAIKMTSLPSRMASELISRAAVASRSSTGCRIVTTWLDDRYVTSAVLIVRICATADDSCAA